MPIRLDAFITSTVENKRVATVRSQRSDKFQVTFDSNKSRSHIGTFYGTGLGACGVTNSDTDLIVAVAHELFDTYP
jgi:hypothetical protein